MVIRIFIFFWKVSWWNTPESGSALAPQPQRKTRGGGWVVGREYAVHNISWYMLNYFLFLTHIFEKFEVVFSLQDDMILVKLGLHVLEIIKGAFAKNVLLLWLGLFNIRVVLWIHFSPPNSFLKNLKKKYIYNINMWSFNNIRTMGNKNKYFLIIYIYIYIYIL